MTKKKTYSPSLYFRGIARMKFVYREKAGKTPSEKTYELTDLYDIYLKDLVEVNALLYNHSTSKIRPLNPSNKAIVNHRSKSYNVELIGLKVMTLPFMLHEQREEDLLVGEFDWVEVYIRIPKMASKSMDVGTGKQKEENGILYEERIQKDGTSVWKVIRAPKGTPTGRIQRKDDLYRSEHYHENGDLYWSPWTVKRNFKVPKDLVFGATGMTKTINGRKHQQVLTVDMKFDWVRMNFKPQFSFAATIVVFAIMSLFFVFLYYLSTQKDGDSIYLVILPLAVSFFVIVPLINFILRAAGKMRSIIVQLNWIILTLCSTLFVVYLISNTLQSVVGNPCSDNFHPMITPSEQWHFSQSNDSIIVDYKWNHHFSNEKKNFQVRQRINTSRICECTQVQPDKNFHERYKAMINSADLYLQDLKRHFRKSIAYQNRRTQDTVMAYSYAVVSYIQSRPYREKKAYKDLLSPAEVIFGIAEEKINFEADCDDRTVAAFFLLKDLHDDLDIAIFNFDDGRVKHSVLGIASKFFDRNPRSHGNKSLKVNDKHYYLWELTSMRHRPGDPIRIKNEELSLLQWKLVLNETSFKE